MRLLRPPTKHRAGLLVAIALACGEYQPPPTSQGELGRGDFTYQCAGQTDPLCPEGSTWATAFPQALAVGGAFSLAYQYDSAHAGDPLPILTTASPSRLANDSGVFTGLVAGYTAILAVTGTSAVIDLKHIRFEVVDHLALTVDGVLAGDSIVLRVGDLLPVVAEARSRQDLVLAGSLPYAWTIQDPLVASISGSSADDKVFVQANAIGETSLKIVAGDHVVDVPIYVEMNPATTSTTDDSTTDATTDATTSDATTSDSTTDDSTTSDSTTDTSTTDDSTSGVTP